jgi:hypothetical protein
MMAPRECFCFSKAFLFGLLHPATYREPVMTVMYFASVELLAVDCKRQYFSVLHISKN